MAQQVEPMDIDSSVCDFDDKENTFQHNNALPRTPCTEKGYEELDVSELNMKLRYSVTPAASPMSKSYAGNLETKNYDSDNTLDAINANMTRSLNTTMTKNDTINKSQKTLPLQGLSVDHSLVADGNRNVLQPLDTTLTVDKNITVTVSKPNDDENISLPSSSSSMTHTPEATTPTKEIPKDGGSPIIRGLKSVLNMFRPSQSPIPGEDDVAKLETLSPPIVNSPDTSANSKDQSVSASTPLVGNKTKELLTKRKSPSRDSLVFNEDFEKELEWKDDSTILFSHEKIPIHKLFFQQSQTEHKRALDFTKLATDELEKLNQEDNLNATVEYMDVSYTDSGILDKTATQVSDFNKSVVTNPESDCEFLDCETTFTKNESFKLQDGNELDSTEDVLSHINDIVESNNQKLNASIETLNGADVKSGNLSTASIETTKSLDMSNEPLNNGEVIITDNKNQPPVILDNLQKEDLVQDSQREDGGEPVKLECLATIEANKPFDMSNEPLNNGEVIITDNENQPPEIPDNLQKEDLVQDSQTEDGGEPVKLECLATNEAVPAVSLDNDLNTTHVINCDSSDVLRSNLAVENDINVVNAPLLDNVGLKSLSQIPLIVDPRVLLFNIPLDSEGDKKNENITINVLQSSPADIPLPEDDEIPSLPVMNSELENISHTLDKIAEEIPKINQHESSVSSVDFMSDQRSTESPTENRSSPAMKCLKSSETQSLDCPKAEVSSISRNVENPKNVKDDCTTDAVPLTVFTNATNEENLLLSTKPIEISEDNNVLKLEIGDDSSIPVSFDNQNRSGEINYSSIAKTNELPQTLNISVSEHKLLDNTDMAQVVTENTMNVNGFAFEAQTSTDNTPIVLDKAEGDVNDQASNIVNHCVNFSPVFISNISRTTDANTHFTAINIEFIKEEVEAIFARAVDIATKKTNENLEQVEKIPEDQQEADSNNVKEGVIKSQALLQDLIEPTKHIVTNDEDPNEQQMSLNQLSDTIQDNINIPKMEDDMVKEPSSSDSNIQGKEIVDSEKELEGSAEETLATTNITTIDLNDDIATKFKTFEENVIDETPLDIEKVDQGVETNEVTDSANNSPFVSVAKESLVADEVQPAETFEGVENLLSTNSEINTVPPSSPKIVSKGYNFNFDEIDDPFATKTKIRMSPSLDTSTNQSFEVIKKPELVKKEVSNRRKSQPDRKRSVVNNKKLNSTFAGTSSVKPHSTAVVLESAGKVVSSPVVKIETVKDSESPDLKEIANGNQTSEKTKEIKDISANFENIPTTKIDVKDSNETKGISSSEQSTYFSAGTSSDEATEIKPEIKIPDFEDPNFDPFASKSKIRQSPTPGTVSNPFATRSRICQTPPPTENNEHDCTEKNNTSLKKVDTESLKEVPSKSLVKTDTLEEIESSQNISIMTSSSNNDKENTIREVNTEDEDTVEGPFLELDDLQIEDKMSDFDCGNVDMIKFSELPPENVENQDAGEMFIDAEAFEFLLNQNKSNTVTDSGKESLFLKFDPLFAKRISSDGVMAALKQVKVKQSTPINNKNLPFLRDATFDIPPVESDVTFDKQSVDGDATFDKQSVDGDATFDKSAPLPGPSGLNRTRDMDPNSTGEESFDDLNVTVSKPMMVVNPAVNPVVTPRNKTITPVRSNRQSLTFTSPAIAVIDRLLSMSAGNNSLMAHDTTVAEVHRDNEADLALTQLRELLADKEISVYNLRSETKELQNRLSILETQMKSLETISEDRLKKINELNGKLDEKTRINKKMAQVVEEYERTIASLIAEKEMDKKRHAEERLQLIKERDEQTAHLASMEVSFSDLHSKYEKSKQIILGFKANEDAYKKSIKEFEDNLAKMQNNYELLKQHATSKLNHANDELQKINRAHEAEVLKMNAMIKRKELHITSLEETLQQKTKANEELTAICDELINKVG